MAEQYHLDLLHQGIDVWNQWRQDHHSIQPDFSGVDFKGAQLRRVNLAGARVTGTDFSGADFSEADLSGIDFSRANTHGARLGKAYFSRRADMLLDDSSRESSRADMQPEHGKQRVGIDAEDLDERVHEDWANDE